MKPFKIAVLLLVAAVALFPLYWMVIGAFQVMRHSYRMPPTFWPYPPTLENFERLLQFPLGLWTWNSIVVCVAVVTLSIGTSMLAAYAIEIKRFRGWRVVFITFLVSMMLAGQLGLIPTFRMLRKIGLTTTRLGLILPFMFSAFGVFVGKQYFVAFPREVLDAADIDGCGEFWKLVHIVTPLCKPVLATLAIFGFIGAWNNVFWQSIIGNKDKTRTLLIGVAYAMMDVAQRDSDRMLINWGLVMAGAVIVMVPMAIVFLALNRHFTKGLYIGRGK